MRRVREFTFQKIQVISQELNLGLRTDELPQLYRQARDAFSPDPMSACLWSLVKPDDELFHRLSKSLTESIAKMGWERYRSMCNLHQGALRVLHTLSRSYSLGLADNQPEIAMKLVRDADLDALFSIRPGKLRNTTARKPDIRFFTNLLAKSETMANKIVFVGSSIERDIVPALAVGMKTILVQYHGTYNPEPRTPDEYPHLKVESIKQLPDAVRTLEIAQ